MRLEIYYKQFCLRQLQHDEGTDSFRDFYEHLNIRTYSKAICETIGSIMGIALANGRNLEPPNLNKEVYIRFNSPPLHILQRKFIPAVAARWKRQKEFSRRCKKKSGLRLDHLSHTLEGWNLLGKERRRGVTFQ